MRVVALRPQAPGPGARGHPRTPAITQGGSHEEAAVTHIARRGVLCRTCLRCRSDRRELEAQCREIEARGRGAHGGTRVYTEANGLYTLDQKLTGADGKEKSSRTQYRDGKEEKQAPGGPTDVTVAKKIDANTWDFDLKKAGKVVGHVHRVVSADGKTLTVHNAGAKLSGAGGDETLVFDKQ